MRVRFLSDYVTEEQRASLGRRPHGESLASRLTIGAEYLVLGLDFEADPDHYSTGPYVTVQLDNGLPLRVDMCLFEVTDPRASRYWHVHAREFDGRQLVEILPPVLFDVFWPPEDDERSGVEQDEEYFAFLSSEEYQRTCALLRDEYGDTP